MMTTSGESIELENDRVLILRVRINGHEKHPQRERKDRVLVWVTNAEERRTEPSGKVESIHRKAGEATWRSASTHQIENLSNEPVEVVIVELK